MFESSRTSGQLGDVFGSHLGLQEIAVAIEILQALLDIGRDEVVRDFARHAVGRDGDLAGISSLVEEG